jgi:hypothetical protein
MQKNRLHVFVALLRKIATAWKTSKHLEDDAEGWISSDRVSSGEQAHNKEQAWRVSGCVRQERTVKCISMRGLRDGCALCFMLEENWSLAYRLYELELLGSWIFIKLFDSSPNFPRKEKKSLNEAVDSISLASVTLLIPISCFSFLPQISSGCYCYYSKY